MKRQLVGYHSPVAICGDRGIRADTRRPLSEIFPAAKATSSVENLRLEVDLSTRLQPVFAAMSLPPTPTPARSLLNFVMPRPGQPSPTDATVDRAMADFVAEITQLDLNHNKGKNISDVQLAEQVFRSRL